MTDFQTFFGYFYVFQVVEHTKYRFRMITFKNETLKKNPKNSFLLILPILATIYKVKRSRFEKSW
jgi:hypothetical protein